MLIPALRIVGPATTVPLSLNKGSVTVSLVLITKSSYELVIEITTPFDLVINTFLSVLSDALIVAASTCISAQPLTRTSNV